MIGVFACGILFLVQVVLLWIQFGKPESAKLQALQHHALPIGGACEGVQLVLLVLDFTGVLDFSGYTGLPLWCAVFGAVQLGCDLISHKLETGGQRSALCGVAFAWELILDALVIAFLLYPRASKSTKRHLNRLMIGAGVVSLILNFAQIYRWILDSLSPDWKADALSFARLFEFWR